MMDINQVLKENSNRLSETFLKNSFDTIPLIEYCAGTSTIRAFHKSKGYSIKYKPLSIFRYWAFDYLNDNQIILNIKSTNNFKKIRSDALKNLIEFWTINDGGKPEFYQFNKLIDLLFKCLPLWMKLDTTTKLWLFNNVNVPLDKFSLDLLRRCNEKLNIPKNASMNYVTSRNYNKLQVEIIKLCNEHAPILFDLYAWDETHRPKECFVLIPLEKKKVLSKSS
jgi:hypothetical protein